MKRILCAVDGSESASSALDFAIELCRDTGAALTVIAVRTPIPPGRGSVGAILPIEEVDGVRQIGEEAVETAEAAGVDAKVVLTSGNAAHEIASAAERLGVDLIVVGSRGLGAVAGILMGSVSHALVKRAPAPVTVVASRVLSHT
jgi:nucleotide-binding universal stress UspA family protein